MSPEYEQLAANAICHAAEMTKETFRWTLAAYEAPSAIWRPRLFIDGNQWCALYGDNLQDGVAGFGDSPQEAMWDFDKAWCRKLTPSNAEVSGAGTASAGLPGSAAD